MSPEKRISAFCSKGASPTLRNRVLLLVVIVAFGTGLLGTVGAWGDRPVGTEAANDSGQATTRVVSPEQEKATPQEPSAEVSVLSLSPAQLRELRWASLPVGPTLDGALSAPGYAGELEPNDTVAAATPLGDNLVLRGTIVPNGDLDFYSFNANAGNRVYAAIMGSFSSSGSNDSQLRLFASDGVTLIEFDEDDGALGALSSTIAGATIPSQGTYYLQVKHFSATAQLRPYELHFRVQSGVPTPEVEANDTPGTANPLPANGWVSGTRNPAVATEQDWYSLSLDAGDTVYLGLDLDPERDAVMWNGRLGLALFGDAANQIVVIDDASAGSAGNPLSEAMFFTVKTAGTYYAFVDSATAATGGPTATYHLSVSVHPAATEGVNCTTYTSTNVPQTIGAGAGLVSSTITVPGNPWIADVNVGIVLNHDVMADIDAHLRSPAGNDNALFNDIGAAAIGGQTMMDTAIDDEAGIPPVFTVLKGISIKPELNYRLDWFDGENAGGVWTLDLRDDVANTSGGTLTAWSLTICEMPAAMPSTTIFSADFEANDGGFTHSGTLDEWERGLPATVGTTTANPVAGITTCNSGMTCWKTDLDSTYDISSNQDLFSPSIVLPATASSIALRWAQWFQLESATFDHYFVEVREVGNPANALKVFEWLGATMTSSVGSPAVGIPASAGWARLEADITRFVNKTIEVRFHVDSDTSINFAGVAIDDVTVSTGNPVPTAPVTFTSAALGNGSLGYPSASGQQVLRVARNGIVSTCASPKSNPGTTASGAFTYDAYLLKNTSLVTACVEVTVSTACMGTNAIFPVAYLGSFIPANPSTNWLADPGGSPNPAATFSFNLASGATARLVVSEVTGGGGCSSYTVTIRGLTARVPYDTNYDLRTDHTVFREGTGVWYTALSGGGTTGTAWGTAGDIDVMGDYDGDGKADVAVWRPSTGTWFIVQSNTGTIRTTVFGRSGDIPLAGDVDGDGKVDLVVYRPSTSEWWFSRSTGGTSVLVWGLSTDQPLLGDFDGDGRADPVAHRGSSGVWYISLSGGGTSIVPWGTIGDIPVIGNWDGDAKSDPAVFRPSTGQWWVSKSTGGLMVVNWGTMGDVPVSGDMDGDGKSDFNIFRSGVWYSQLSGGGSAIFGWGIAGDKPVGRKPGL